MIGRAVIGIALVTMLGCGTDGDSVSVVVRDSAGVRIVENPAAAPDLGWRVGERPVVDIGGGDSPEDQLFRVMRAVRLSDDRIVVANTGTHEIKFFDADGEFLGTVGREGDGPGEFRLLFRMFRLPDDSIAAFDSRQQRLTVFGPDGGFVRSASVERLPDATRVTPVGPLGDGTWLAKSAPLFNASGESGFHRLDLILARYERSGAFRDTVVVVPGFETFVHHTHRGPVIPTLLFGRGADVATRNDQVLVGVNDSYEIRQYGVDGRLQTIVRRAVMPRPVTSDDVRAVRQAELAPVQSVAFRELLSEAYDAMPIPEAMPAFGRPAGAQVPWIVPDPSGGFWVVDYHAPAEAAAWWSVFDKDGRFLGTLRLPDRFDLLEVGDDYVLGRWLDDLDVEHVQQYELFKP